MVTVVRWMVGPTKGVAFDLSFQFVYYLYFRNFELIVMAHYAYVKRNSFVFNSLMGFLQN